MAANCTTAISRVVTAFRISPGQLFSKRIFYLAGSRSFQMQIWSPLSSCPKRSVYSVSLIQHTPSPMIFLSTITHHLGSVWAPENLSISSARAQCASHQFSASPIPRGYEFTKHILVMLVFLEVSQSPVLVIPTIIKNSNKRGIDA